MTPIDQQSDGLSLRAYLRVVARWKWLILALAVVCCALAFGYAHTRTPLYQATAQLIYEPQVNVADLSSGASVDEAQRTADIEGVSTVIDSADVSRTAKNQLGNVGDNWYTVTAKPQLAADNSGSYSNIVLVVGVSPNANVAAKAANAYSQAFVVWRRQREQSRLQQAASVVQDTLATYDTPAARASTEYLMLQQEYRNLLILKETATGNFSVIIQATTPSAPFSPRVARTGAIGLAGGLVLGLLLAFLLEQFDTRLRGEEQIVDMLPYPVLGRIPRTAKKAMGNGSPVATLGQPSGRVAESFRMLRSNLDFVNVDGGVRSVLFTSSAQQEGKSVAICNLAVSLALSGKRVVLVDCDLRSPHVHTYLGLSNAVGLSSVLVRGVKLEEAIMRMPLSPVMHMSAPLQPTDTPADAHAAGIVKVSSGGGATAATRPLWPAGDNGGELPLMVLTSGVTPPNAGELVASTRLKAIIDELSEKADIVLVDAPAMLVVGDTAALASRVDGLVFIVDPEIVRRPMLERAAEQLGQLPCRKLGLVFVTNEPGEHYYTYHKHHAGDVPQRRRRTT
jgi:polysaccharide biosynthesis transport protein